MERLGAEIGATDLFVLRRVEGDRYFNLGGLGRGAGWSGNVEVDANSEPWVASAIDEGVARKRSGVPFKVFGPYWSNEVAAATTGESLVVVGGRGVTELTDQELRSAAERAATLARAVLPEKLEADEAEVQQALDELLRFEGSDIEEAAKHLASTTARSLSCEFSAVLLLDPQTKVYLAEEGWSPNATEDEIIAALLPLHQVAQERTYVEQDISLSPFPFPPLSHTDGLVARCCVPLGEGGRLGMLFAAHAGTVARGFTTLCTRVASTMGEAGVQILR